eukprot:TRINITY_DN6352_c0_g1_i2.p1 TRINITY_DN6352_c0_g1~~TRINITY_DN6352_c0_g1_i2.p1  ORF type:complete len:300 (-),score=70.37 TRINITY_DN6352_c0_g1_i2:49-873(-)
MSTVDDAPTATSNSQPVAAPEEEEGDPTTTTTTALLPFEIKVTPVSSALELYNALKESANERFRHTIDLIEKCIDDDESKNGVWGLAFSFNGGKDCTVVLHLLRAVFAHKGIETSDILTVYFDNADDFAELKEFMHSVSRQYGFKVQVIKQAGFKDGIQQLLKDHPTVKYFFMGQRRNDPHAKNLNEIHISDVHKGWPEFYRVNPILEWGYKDVWTFLRGYELSYCSLYDRGYTSLGSHQRTSPNVALQEGGKFLPAYYLTDDNKERAGRGSIG